jgi:predicted DNA-binding transcriptional regulator YafY
MELSNERGALERALMHFASFECEAYTSDNETIRLDIVYPAGDESELLIRVLAFGPLLRVLAPERLVILIRERVKRQMELLSDLK